jgi:predicted nucleotidyltransferase
LYGSYARESHLRPESDFDLMVIGDVTFGNVVDHTALAQERLGRDVNPTVYSREEFAKRTRDGSQFLRDVLEHPKLFLIGGPRELERLAQVGMAHQPQTDPRRNRGIASRRRPGPAR